MSFNGSGSFVINSTGQPCVASTLIEASVFNALTADLATGLSTAICKDGQTVITANIGLAGFKLTGVGAATARTDAATLATIQDGTGIYVATVGGTADVITLTASPAITAYAAGQAFYWIASGANTTNVTVNVNSVGAKAVTKNGTTALVAGDIPSGALVGARYDGTRFQLLGPGGSTGIPLSLIDAAGDLIYGSAADTAARLAIGTARQALMVNAGATAPAWTNPITLGTMQATTSGTAFNYTSLPAGIRRITIEFVGVSLSGTDNILVQIGAAGGIETTSYVSSSGGMQNAGVISVVNSTSGFIIQSESASNVFSGSMTLGLVDAATFQWVSSHSGKTTTTVVQSGAGNKALSAELTQLTITRTGTDTFDAGAVNISYE